MTITYNTTVAGARLTVVRDAIDQGSGAGTLELCTATYAAVLATITLNDPSGTISSRVLTLSGFPKSATIAGNGTPTLARIKDSNGTVIADGLTVGTSGTDVVLTATTFNTGETCTITSATITHP